MTMIDQRDFDNVDILVDMYLKQHIPSGRYGQAQSQRQSPGQVLFNGYIFFAMNMNMTWHDMKEKNSNFGAHFFFSSAYF